MRKNRSREAIVTCALVLGTLLAVGPVLGVLVLALQEQSPARASIDLGDATHFENFSSAWVQGEFSRSMPTSIVITLLVLAIGLPCSTLAAYALVILRMPLSAAITCVFAAGIFLPVEAYVVPLFFNLRNLGIDGSIVTVVLTEVAINIAFGTLWMRSSFLTIPGDLVDAARMDGASSFTVLTQTLVPVARPHLLSLAVLMFVWTWNDLLAPLVLLSASDLRTVPMSLSSFIGQNVTNYPLVAAAAIIVILPVMLMYVLLQRSFVTGILGGSGR